MASDKNTELIKKQFSTFLRSVKRSKRKSVYKNLLEYIDGWNGRAFLFGGAARDIYFMGKDAKPSDFDVVLIDSEIDEFLEGFKEYQVVRNNFGGYKISYQGVSVDVWEIENTWAFKNKRVEYSGIKSILETTFLNIESILIELNPKRREREVYYQDFFSAVENEVLDVNFMDNPNLELSYSRIIHFSIIHNLSFSGGLISWMRNHVLNVHVKDVLKKYEAKYGLVEREQNRILRFFDDLKSNKDDELLYNFFIKNESFQRSLFS